MVLSAPRIGTLRERITLSVLAETPATGGGLVASYDTLFNAWAYVRAARAGRYVADAQIEDQPTQEFLIRHRSEWRQARFITWSGRRYRIVAASEVEPRVWVQYAAVEER